MVLSIDLSDGSLTLSLRREQEEIILFKKRLNHVEQTPHILQNLFRAENISLSELKRLAFISGPGNYTGLRASILIIRSLAMRWNLPVWHLTRLQAMLFACQHLHKSIWVSQFVRMNQYYFAKGLFSSEGFRFDLAPQTATAESLKSHWEQSPGLAIGDWTNLPQVKCLPEILTVSALSQWCSTTTEKPTAWNEIEPFYIRPAVN